MIQYILLGLAVVVGFTLLGFWFVIQFFSGMRSLSVQGAGGVAWWAHIGGFVLGVSLLFVFQKPRPKRRSGVCLETYSKPKA